MRSLCLLVVLTLLVACNRKPKEEAFLQLADRHFAAGELEQAKIDYLNVLRAKPVHPRALRQLGFIWLELGSPIQALPFLLKALEDNRDDLELRGKVATACLSLEDVPRARQEALAILQKDPSSALGISILAETLRNAADLEETSKILSKFPQKDSPGYHLAAAKLAFAQGDFQSANKALDQAILLDPKSVDPRLARAGLFYAQSKFEQAQKELEAAAQLAPLRSNAQLKLVESHLRAGRYADARTLLTTLTEKHPEFIPPWVLLARMSLTEKKHADALAHLDNAFRRDPESLEGHLLRVQIWLDQGEIQKARGEAEHLHSVYPDVLISKFALARVLLATRELAKATEILKQAVSQRPNSEQAVFLLATVQMQQGDFAAVIPAVIGLLKRNPALVDAQMLLAEAYRASGRLEDAAGVLTDMVNAAPKSAPLHYLLGSTLRSMQKWEQAQKVLLEGQKLAPENPEILREIVQLDLARKDSAAAMARIEQYLARAPKNPALLVLKGGVLIVDKSWEKAEAVLKEALEINPEFSRAYDALIDLYSLSNQLPKAIAELDQLTAKYPANPRFLRLQALLCSQVGEYSKARDFYDKLLAILPQSAAALNNLAYIYAEPLKDLDKALELAQKARSLANTDPAVADTLGWVHFQRGDYEKALVLLKESAGKMPGNPETQYHLGMAQYQLGLAEDARAALTAAASAPVQFKGQEEARRRLARLDSASKASSESPEKLEALIKENPGDVILQSALAQRHEAQGEHAKAAEVYQAIARERPKLTAPALKLAQLHAGPLKNPAKALELARAARESNPSDAKLLAGLARVAFQAKDFPWSYSLFRECATQTADDPSILKDFAWAAYSLGLVDEAQRKMKDVQRIAPNTPLGEEAARFLATTDLEATTTAPAIPAPQNGDPSDPSSVPALMAQARLHQLQGQSAEAEKLYRDVLKALPNFSLAEKRLATLLAKNPATIPEAAALAERAWKTLPDDLELKLLLAEVKFAQSDYEKVVQLLKDVPDRAPLTANHLFYLGMSYRALFKPAESRSALGRALAKGLQEPHAGSAKLTLLDLEKAEQSLLNGTGSPGFLNEPAPSR